MRKTIHVEIADVRHFKKQFFSHFKDCKHFVYLDSNSYKPHPAVAKSCNNYELIAGYGLHKVLIPKHNFFGSLKKFMYTHSDYLFGVLSYELKNDIENLQSSNPDRLRFPEMIFFIPKTVFYIKQNTLTVEYLEEHHDSESITKKIESIQTENIPQVEVSATEKIQFTAETHRKDYQECFKHIKAHIHYGDIYELNYCINFSASVAHLNSHAVFMRLNEAAPAPFAGYFRFGHQYLMSFSPERFMKKCGDKIISQPMKGTAPRGASQEEEKENIRRLKSDPKERAENIMISDLTRNDLSRTAARNSVKTEELCEVYPYSHVLQMISTISSRLRKDLHAVDALRAAFPPGSMTGAPKVRAMKLADQYENFQRSWYAGSLGYFTPKGDFDFNVIIRSLLHNADNGRTSYAVGGALTYEAQAEKEYAECLLKAESFRQRFDV